MSYVYRKIKKYTINLLEVFAFSRVYDWISVFILILTWFDLFGAASIYLNSFIVLSWIIGWLYQIYTLEKENEQLRSINTSLSMYDAFYIREDLAALMHDIWVEEANHLITLTDAKYDIVNTHYNALSEEDKEINLAKADRVFKFLKDKNNTPSQIKI